MTKGGLLRRAGLFVIRIGVFIIRNRVPLRFCEKDRASRRM
jgi:hypothetical protein